MLLKRVQTTIIFKDLLNLTGQNSLASNCTQEVLALLKNFNHAAIQEISVRPHFGEKRFESAVLRIWELAKVQYNTSSDLGWKQVMSYCNVVYEAIAFTREKAKSINLEKVA